MLKIIYINIIYLRFIEIDLSLTFALQCRLLDTAYITACMYVGDRMQMSRYNVTNRITQQPSLRHASVLKSFNDYLFFESCIVFRYWFRLYFSHGNIYGRQNSKVSVFSCPLGVRIKPNSNPEKINFFLVWNKTQLKCFFKSKYSKYTSNNLYRIPLWSVCRPGKNIPTEGIYKCKNVC